MWNFTLQTHLSWKKSSLGICFVCKSKGIFRKVYCSATITLQLSWHHISCKVSFFFSKRYIKNWLISNRVQIWLKIRTTNLNYLPCLISTIITFPIPNSFSLIVGCNKKLLCFLLKNKGLNFSPNNASHLPQF